MSYTKSDVPKVVNLLASNVMAFSMPKLLENELGIYITEM